MHVLVGPVESASARAFADYADGVLVDHGDDLPSDVHDAFVHYLADWRAKAGLAPTLVWESEVSVDVGEYLVLAFYRLAQRIDAGRGSPEPILAPEVAPFYQALVSGLLCGMDDAGPAAAEFADHLRGFWPGQAEA